MSRNLLKSTLLVAIAISCWQSIGNSGFAQDAPGIAPPAPASTLSPEPQTLPDFIEDGAGNVVTQPDLFYNYYPNTTSGIASAELYPAPIATPPIVGHTYYTYQPLLPHEYMYSHRRTYYNYYGQGQMYNPAAHGNCNTCAPGGNGVTKTTVVYHHAPFSYYTNGGFRGHHWPLSIFPGQNIRALFHHGKRGKHCGGCGHCKHCQECQTCR